MSAELALLDSNVLIYAYYEESQHHAAALSLLNQAQDGLIDLCLVPQVLAEFYAVVTDSRRVTDAYRPDEALDVIDEILAMPGLRLLPLPADVVTRWTGLVRQHPVSGAAVFDTQLVATMLGSGVSRLYTFNRSHFERYEELQVLTPQSVD